MYFWEVPSYADDAQASSEVVRTESDSNRLAVSRNTMSPPANTTDILRHF
jgi:hypothetical protein